ncbi:MAG: hypothetical protein KGH76_03510 [Thaumarchaeota archaeon]|nr:hypothetical protein [Nitrososphaerota archaeon]MDE1843306.1 hypothetical protein [Nitrososphaerota archaeon]
MHKETFKVTYSNKNYLYLSIAIFAILLVALGTISQFIFFSPVFVFYIPQDSVFSFGLIVAISLLSGIVASMSIYRMRLIKNGLKSGVGFFGSIIGAGAGACSCGPIGFSLVPALGTVGGTATAFLSNYETPLRLGSIAILGITYFVSAKEITAKCKIVK